METRRAQGFSLLEMSVVLLIIGLVVAGSAALLSAAVQRQAAQETYDKLATIQKALLDYRRAFNRLPCPAGLTVALTNASFGKEVGTPGSGTCTGADSGVHGRVYGMVPTKTLQLPDEAAIDGWGRRIVYAMYQSYSATDRLNPSASNYLPITDGTSMFTIRDITGADKTQLAAYILLSFGPNGKGAWSRSGTRVADWPSDTQEQTNCRCNLSGAGGASILFVQHVPTINAGEFDQAFDDIVVYGTRADLHSYQE